MPKFAYSIAFAGICGALLAAPAGAQMKPAGHDDIASAINACRAISSPTWIDLDALPGMGWRAAEKRGQRRTAEKIRGIYQMRGNAAYLVIGHDQLEEKSCSILARLESTAAYTPLVQQLASSQGMPTRQDGPTYFWETPDYSMVVEPSGERNAPNMQITIKALKESAE